MSDFRAIGGVSATLQALLLDRMELPDGVPSAAVTVGPPPYSVKDSDPHKEDPRVNLFLYRVSENGYLQNQEIPGRGAASGYGHPPLSLNLHYLVTAYGNAESHVNGTSLFDDTGAQLLLGSAMRVLHDVPIVTEQVTSVRPPSGTVILHESLRDGYERVRLSLEPLTLEDVTKVWTALALRYRLSAAYVVNVVQIESRRTRTFPRAVGKPVSATVPPLPSDPPSPGPWVQALTIATPTITDVRVRRAGGAPGSETPYPYAAIGDTLVLLGTSLSGPETDMVFGDVSVPAVVAGPQRVEATIPDASTAGGAIPPERRLQPGVRTVRVVARNPAIPHASFGSNEAPFMLVPAVDTSIPLVVSGSPRRLEIHGTRLLPAGPGGETMIGRSAVARTEYLPASAADHLLVPIPATLPAQGVHVVVGDPLGPGPVPIGGGPRALRIDIGGTVLVQGRTIPGTTLPLDQVAGIVEGMIRDAGAGVAPPDPRFTGARVVLWQQRLIVVPGDLVSTIVIDSPGGGGLAAALGLTAVQPAGASDAAVSGALGSPPPLTSPAPRIQVHVMAAAPVTVDVARATSLEALATDLEVRLAAFPAPAYSGARVAVLSGQLLVIPGIASPVRFDAVPGGDDRTVVELQLHARFSVRVRVNGAESIDLASVELPA